MYRCIIYIYLLLLLLYVYIYICRFIGSSLVQCMAKSFHCCTTLYISPFLFRLGFVHICPISICLSVFLHFRHCAGVRRSTSLWRRHWQGLILVIHRCFQKHDLVFEDFDLRFHMISHDVTILLDLNSRSITMYHRIIELIPMAHFVEQPECVCLSL